MKTLNVVLSIGASVMLFVAGYAIGSRDTYPVKEAGPEHTVGETKLDFDPYKPSPGEPWIEYQQPATPGNKAEWIEEANKKLDERQAAKDQAELIAEAVVDEQEARDKEKPRP